MTRRMLATLAILGSLVATGSWAAVGEANSDLATTLLRLSGMERQIATIATGFDEQLAGSAERIPAATHARLVAEAKQSFDANQLHRTALAHLNANMDPTHAEQALVWLRSEPGRRITRIEEAASDPSTVETLQAYPETLRGNPPEASRVALLTRFDKATRAVDMSAAFMFEMTAATARGLLAAQPNAEAASRLDATLAATLRAIKQRARNMTLVSLLFTYRTLSDAELLSYIEFLETDSGRWYQETTSDAFLGALRAGAERFEAGLGAAAKAEAPAK